MCVKTIIKKIIGCLPPSKYILFESCPDYSDNTRYVFEEMVRRGMNKKYKMIWLVSDSKSSFPEIENTVYLDTKTTVSLLKVLWYKTRARCLISCNRFVETVVDNQCSFYLTHGTAVKSVRSYYNLPSKIDYVLTASERSSEIVAYEIMGDKEKFHALGFPRNDVFNEPKKNMHLYFEQGFDKIIVWYPTFRQHRNGKLNGSKNGLPLLHDIENVIRLNDFASQNKTLIVVKPHFAEDITYIKEHHLSNVLFIDEKFFEKNNLSSYEFVGSCDALLTDYSSIYFDYLLCNRPVGVVWEDIEEYKENQGFAIDLDEYMKGSYKIYSIDHLLNFVESVAKNEDAGLLDRQKICELMNFSKDGKNSQRVVDFIIEKADLK